MNLKVNIDIQRALCLLLAVLMLFACVPLQVMASEQTEDVSTSETTEEAPVDLDEQSEEAELETLDEAEADQGDQSEVDEQEDESESGAPVLNEDDSAANDDAEGTDEEPVGEKPAADGADDTTKSTSEETVKSYTKNEPYKCNDDLYITGVLPTDGYVSVKEASAFEAHDGENTVLAFEMTVYADADGNTPWDFEGSTEVHMHHKGFCDADAVHVYKVVDEKDPVGIESHLHDEEWVAFELDENAVYVVTVETQAVDQDETPVNDMAAVSDEDVVSEAESIQEETADELPDSETADETQDDSAESNETASTESSEKTYTDDDPLRAGDGLYVTGVLPSDGVLEATDADAVDVAEGEESLSAYDINVYESESASEAWQIKEKVTVHIYDESFVDQEIIRVYRTPEGSDPVFVAEVEPDDGWITFEDDELSVYTFTKVVRKVITAGEEERYQISVEYEDGNDFPKGAELSVEEITPEAEAYAEYEAAAKELLNAEELSEAKFFDISILNEDGEELQPKSTVKVTISLLEDTIDKESTVIHMSDSCDLVEAEIEDNTVSFQASGFSVYAIVSAPVPASPVTDPVEAIDLSELYGDEAQGGFLMSVDRNGTEQYFTSQISSGCFGLNADALSAATWYFEPVEGGTNQYKIGVDTQSGRKYIINTTNNNIGLDENGAKFEVSIASAGRFYIKLVGANKWLQYSGSGKGIRFWTDKNNAANSSIALTYASSVQPPNDLLGLDGKTYGIVNFKSGTYGYALMAEEAEENGATRLASKQLLVRTDPLGQEQNSTLFVANNSNITMWTFHAVRENVYTLSANVGGAEKYLRVNGKNLSLVDAPDGKCELRVTVGSGNNSDKIRLLGTDNAVHLASTPSQGFVGANDNGTNEWVYLADLSVYGEEDFVNYSAKKVSVSDTVNVKNGTEVVLYTRTWNESEKAYEFYALNQDGSFVRCYESGDDIVWVGSRINTFLWTMSEYYYEGTNDPNYYYDFQNVYSGKYLAPQLTDNQVFSDSPVGVNMNGRRYGDYYTDIVAWDDPHFDYAALAHQMSSKKLVSAPTSQGSNFYVAVMKMEEPGEPIIVNTVDHTELGMTMKLVDFNSRVFTPSGSNMSPTTQEQYDVMGTAYYSKAQTQPGLVSSHLGDDGYPVAAGGSLGQLFQSAVPVNHLFLESTYNGSKYYVFDCTQNFAQLTGSNFTVYQQLGTVRSAGSTRQHGQFMPFNSLDFTKASEKNPYNRTNIYGNDLPATDPRFDETLYSFNEPDDYYFGMEIEGHFMQTPNGHDEWGHDIIFEFVGDDDFWLYVDGELVIDLGGIHQALPGTVNYATGKVTVNGKNTTLYKLFQHNYAERNGLNEDDPAVIAHLDEIFQTKTVNGETVHVFKDYSTHNIRIFYMERGGGASNLRMRFNLASVKKGQVLLTKEISGTDKQDFASVKFPFQVYYDTGEGEQLLSLQRDLLTQGYNVTYRGTLQHVEYNDTVEINGVTYQNVFYLKPGQTAAVSVPDDTIRYRIVECGVNTGYLDAGGEMVNGIYQNVYVNGDPIEGQPVSANPGYYDYSTSTEEVVNRAQVVFTNEVNQSELRTLTITKRLFDAAGNELTAEQDETGFRLRIFLGDDLEYYRNGQYHVKNPAGEYCVFNPQVGNFVSTGQTDFSALTQEQQTRATFTTSPSGAADKLPAGYSIEISNLLVGTRFKVEERTSDIPKGYGLRTFTETVDGNTITYTGYKRVAGSYIVGEGDTQNSGVIRDNSNPKIEIHNTRGWNLTAVKEWSDNDFMQSHDDVFLAVYVNGSLLSDTVRKLSGTNVNYFFPSLMPGSVFSDYSVHEVELENPVVNSDGTVSYDAISPVSNDALIYLGGTRKDGSYVSNIPYRVSYTTGSLESSSGNIQNLRTDTVRNKRVGGLEIRVTNMQSVGLAATSVALDRLDGGETASIGSFTSDNNGLLTTLYLDDGTYVLTETQSAPGYHALEWPVSITVTGGEFSVQGDDPEMFAFDSETGTLVIRNKPFTLTVLKIDVQTNQPLEGVHFALYRQIRGVKDYYPLPGFEDVISTNSGVLIGIDQTLPAGSYYLTETQAAEGYLTLDQDICFNISKTGVVTIVSGEGNSSVSVEHGQTEQYTIRVSNEQALNVAPTGYTDMTTPMILMSIVSAIVVFAIVLSKKSKNCPKNTCL